MATHTHQGSNPTATMEEHISPLRDDVIRPPHQKPNNNNNGTPDSTTAVAVMSSPQFSKDSSSSPLSPTQLAAKSSSASSSSSSSSPFSADGTSPISKHSSQTSEQPQDEDEEEALSWDLPPHIPPPDKETLQSLYQQAMAMTLHNNNHHHDDEDEEEKSDQWDLSRYGILSLPDVLLPAVSHQHNQVLRQMQSIAMRDCPQHVSHVTAARTALYHATAQAREACLDARHDRRNHWLGVLEQEVQMQQRQEQEQQDKARALERASQKAELRKKYPANQELWREVAFLMTEGPKLAKEEKIWKQAEAMLEQLQNQTLQPLAQASLEDDDAMDLDEDDRDNNDLAHPQPATDAVLDTVQDVTLACTRIQQSLELVQHALHATEVLRKQVATEHIQAQHHSSNPYYFASSQGSARDLVRHLSQEQD